MKPYGTIQDPTLYRIPGGTVSVLPQNSTRKLHGSRSGSRSRSHVSPRCDVRHGREVRGKGVNSIYNTVLYSDPASATTRTRINW